MFTLSASMIGIVMWGLSIGVLGQSLAPQAGGNDQYVMWAILLLGLAVVLFFLEVFIPSGGILGFSAAVSMIVGIVLFFKVDTTLGLISAIIALASVPFLFAFALKLWPNTPIAKLLMLESSSPTGRAEGDPASSARSPFELVGKRGKALTDLRPVGICLINGQRMDCLAETGVIKSGSTVRVVSVKDMQVKVRVQDEDAAGV